MIRKLLKNYANLSVFLFFLVLALPLLGLSWFNVPSAADDFCFALNTLKFGFWQGQQYYYDGWTGRYFSTFVMHANPLVLGWLGWYKLFPVLVMFFLAHSLYALIHTLVPTSRMQAWILTMALLFLYFFQLPSVVETFFWLPSVAGYSLSMILINYLLVEIIKRSQIGAKSINIRHFVWVAFMIFAIVGTNETPMLALFVILCTIAGLNFLKSWQLSWFWWGILIVLVVSIYLELSAPGNRVRMSYNPVSGQLIPSALKSIRDVLLAIGDWLVHTPLLFLTALFVPIASRWMTHEGINVGGVFKVHPIISIGVWLGILALGVFPGYYGVGIPPPPRTMNLIYWFFLLGWFYNLLIIIHLSHQKFIFQVSKLPHYVKILLGLWIVVMLTQSENIRPLYGDLLKGRAKQYHDEMAARFKQIEANTTLPLIEVQSLSIKPKTLFTEDINTDPTHLWNTCQAEYWGVKAIKLQEMLTPQAESSK